jgi:pantetheine-phosphate adenylyltransferase
MKKAFYGLTGDPITNGHLHVLSAAASMFDHTTVALAMNPSKKGQHAFDYCDRVDMLAKILKSFDGKATYVQIHDNEILVRLAKSYGAQFLVRGLRNLTDFEKEMEIQRFNAKFEPTIQTVFIPTPTHLADVSSSMVKGLVGLDGWETIVADYVPPIVLDYLRAWDKRRRS